MHRILVIGANESSAEMLERAARSIECEFVYSDPQLSSLGKFSELRPVFAIIDTTEAALDTVQLCGHLRESDKDLLVMLISPEGTRLAQGPHINVHVVHPFTARKLSNRITKLLMLSLRHTQPLSVGEFALDPEKRRVSHRDQIVRLTPKEYRLLEFLMRHAGKTLTRKQIMKEVWETDYLGDTRTLDVHVRWLREKLEAEPKNPVYIRTIRRVGYVFCPDECDPNEPTA